MQKLSETDLIINPDGSIYHLNLLPEDIANIVILVGDLDRVEEVSKHFDFIELKKRKREFITHTGYIGKKRITVLSTGIGSDNIDIVLNELDALVNIDFEKRTINNELISLNIIRIGTSGAIQPDIPIGSILASTYGLGFDALMHYYSHEGSDTEQCLVDEMNSHFFHIKKLHPYLTSANQNLLAIIGEDMKQGITATAPGFYAPQGRQVRAKNAIKDFFKKLKNFKQGTHLITNLEMETAPIYALAKILGHNALSINAILANRVTFEISNEPHKIIEKVIKIVLEKLCHSLR